MSEIFDKSLHCDQNAFSVYSSERSRLPLIQAVSEKDVDGMMRFPITAKVSLASKMLDGITPKDEAQRHAFTEIIRKNPAYGLTFWELVRTIAKDHGAGFVPHSKH